MKITPINNYAITNKGINRKYLKPVTRICSAENLGLKLDNIIQTPYAFFLKTGEHINSGYHADVYALQGWDNSYVVPRVIMENRPMLDGRRLRPAEPNYDNIVYEYPNSSTSIRKRIPGEPLHGKFWNKPYMANSKTFFETIKNLSEMPDRVFLGYIDDVVHLRESGFEIDTINPNNFLLDKYNGKINIIDIATADSRIGYVERLQINDFYPFVDSNRIEDIIRDMSVPERKVLVKTVQDFLNRMIDIAKMRGYNLFVPKAGEYNSDFISYVYHNDNMIYNI